MQNTFVLGDCFEYMSTLSAGSVDLLLTDLPYGGFTHNKWDTPFAIDKLWLEVHRVLSPKGCCIFTAIQPFTCALIMSNQKWFRYALVWEKNKSSDHLNSKRKPLRIHEDILVFAPHQTVYNPQYTYGAPYKRWNTQAAVNRQTNYGHHKANVAQSEGKRCPTTVLKFNRVERPLHPTQKPLSLFEYLIQTYSNPGDLVCDPTAGVGTTAVAALQAGRRYWCAEMSQDYYNIAMQRITLAENGQYLDRLA